MTRLEAKKKVRPALAYGWKLFMADLEAIRARLIKEGGDPRNIWTDVASVEALLAEIERLRGLIKGANCDGWCVWCSNTMADGYHRDPDTHDADCPAFTPTGEVR